MDHPIQAEPTRQRLIDAARTEFARFGFEGASTRRIADRAASHQPQINYFFGSKDELWREVVRDIYRDVDDAMSDVDVNAPPGDVLAGVIRRFVAFAHRRPELNQILFHEFAVASPRLDWVISEFTGPSFAGFHQVWSAAVEAGQATPLDPRVAFHSFVGAASLLPVARTAAERLTGADLLDPEVVEAHADAIVALFGAAKARQADRPQSSRALAQRSNQL